VDEQPTKAHLHLTAEPAVHTLEPKFPEIVPPDPAKRSPWLSLTIDLSPLLESREYRLLYTAQAISFFGSMMSFVALPWQMFQITKSSFAVGMLGVAEFVAILSMAFIGGALADYVDRGRMVMLTEGGLALGTILLIINARLEQPQVWVLFVCAALFAALTGLQRPSLESLAPRLVPAEQLGAVAALNSLRGSVGLIGGPALGGLLVVIFGPAFAYAVDLLTFVIALVALSLMRAVPPPPEANRPSVKTVIEGWRYARSRPELLGTYLVDINAMFFGMPMALFPAIAQSYGGASVGLLYAGPAFGALVVSLTSGWTRRVHRHGRAVAIAAACWGLAIIGFGFAGRLWLALLCLALAGAADMISGVFRMIIWNQTIPDHLRGRLAGIELVSYTTGPMLGNAESGMVASLFSIRTSVVSGGILCVVGTGLLMLALPAFLLYDGRAGLARKRDEETARADALNLNR